MRFSTFIILLVIAIVVYAGVRIAPGYVYDFQIQSITDMVAKMYADPGRASNVPNFINRKFEDIQLPIKKEDLKIESNDDTVRVYVDWSYTAVFIPKNQFVPQFQRVYKFHEETVEKLKR